MSFSSWQVAATSAIGIGAVGLYYFSQQPQPAPQPPSLSCTAPLGKAHVFTLASANREERPKGNPNGGSAARWITIDTSSSPSEIAAADLFATDTEFIVYSIEAITSDAPFLVFLSLPRATREKLIYTEPFIDKSIRKLVADGSKVAIVSLASVEEALGKEHLDVDAAAKVSFVWNTGRCGSTLLHKAIGMNDEAMSLSEPFWLVQMAFHQPPLEGQAHQQALQRAIKACVASEVRGARQQVSLNGWTTKTAFAFNPKGYGNHVVAPAAADAMPLAAHAYMYRSAPKVVESFAGLIFKDGVTRKMWLEWQLYGLKGVMGPPISPELAPTLTQLSSAQVAFLTNNFLTGVAKWVTMIAERPSNDPLATGGINVRYDEFTAKDATAKASVVRATLVHLGGLRPKADDLALAKALSVFGEHSQKGSDGAGPKAQMVTEGDKPLIASACAAKFAPLVGKRLLVVQEGGANFYLPKSLGVA